MITKYIVLLLCLLGPLSYASNRMNPQQKTHSTKNDLYCLITIPSCDTLMPAYLPEGMSFEHPAELVPHDSAYGIFYKRGVDSVYRPVWETALNYAIAPEHTVVHEEGKWVVMFDEWDSLGYGNNVVVIYDSTGSMVRSLALADMLPEDKIASFAHRRNSICWFCQATFIEGTDELEIRTASNGEMPFGVWAAVCEDYLRLSLSTGEVISFNSRFDEILATYPDSCYDTYTCPTVRYLYYRMNHPDSSIQVRFDALDLTGDSFDSLCSVYEQFSSEPVWHLGAAFQLLGCQVWFVALNQSINRYILLVEDISYSLDYGPYYTFPVVVKLSDSLLAFPLTPGMDNFYFSVLVGGRSIFESFGTMVPSDSGLVYTWGQGGFLPSVCGIDNMITMPTNVYVHELDFGTRITIDLSKQLEWVRPKSDH